MRILLENDNFVKLKKTLGAIQTITKNCDCVIIRVKDSKLELFFETERNTTKVFSYVDVEINSEINFVKISLKKFLQTLEKLNNNDKNLIFNIKKNYVEISSEISTVKINVYEELENSYIEDLDSLLLEKTKEIMPYSVILTQEFQRFFSSISSLMSITNKYNSICISETKDKASFFDETGMVIKTFNSPISYSDTDVYLQRDTYDKYKSLDNLIEEDLVIYFNDKVAMVKNDYLNFSSISSIGQISFERPTEEEIIFTHPRSDREVVITIDKTSLSQALSLFKGFFSQDSYFWRQFFLCYNSIDNTINFSYSDINGEIDTNINFIECSSNFEINDDIKFLLPGLTLSSVLNSIEEDVFDLIFNDLDKTEEHGLSLLLRSKTSDVIIPKLNII